MQHYQVTLTTGNTVYSLLTLVKTADTNYKDTHAQVWVSADDGNTVAVFLGGSAVSASAHGVKLYAEDIAAESVTIVPFALPPGRGLNGLYAVAASDSQKVNILVM